MSEPVADAGGVDLGAIERARVRIAAVVRTTPLETSASLSERAGAPVYLKLEQQQITGSFKLRGAGNAVAALDDAERGRGVIGVSTGNHGRALAYAARRAGAPCIICMSRLVPRNKIEGIRVYGAETRIVGRSQDDAQVEVERLVERRGMTMIPPFDHREVIAGQGTLGLELAEQLPEIETALVPVSGGGLIAGVGLALKAHRPGLRLVGVSMQRGAAMYQCLQAGKPKAVEELATLADSLGGGIGLDNRYTFALAREMIDDFVLVSEVEIAAAIRHAYWHERQIVEGSGAVGIAALLSGKCRPSGPTVVLLTGANIAMALHHRIIGGEDVDVSLETEG